jgi:hypothetical protein
MSTVQLSDVIDVVVFQDLPGVNTPERTAFYNSGVIAASPLLNQIANQAGKTAELPFWNDLDATDEPNISTDDPTDIASPGKIDQGEQIGRKAFLNNGWSTSNLATEIAMGERAMDRIRSRVDAYWTRQWQRRLLAAAQGVLADNVANDGSDMVIDVAGATNADVTATSVFTRSNFTSAAFTSGDHFDDYQAIAVHSAVYKRMVDNDDITFIKDSVGNLTVPTYLGRIVICDDGMPFTPAAGTGTTDAAPKFTSILFGAGAFGQGDGTPAKPVAISSDEEQGEGAGIETLWTRKTWLLHPFGFQSTGTPASISQTLAELRLAASWDRVVNRKSIPLAFLVTNG